MKLSVHVPLPLGELNATRNIFGFIAQQKSKVSAIKRYPLKLTLDSVLSSLRDPKLV